MTDIPRLMADYDAVVRRLERFRPRLENLVRDLVAGTELPISEISSRVKDAESLEKKLRRPDRVYEQLCDVTDLLGLRVVTFFAEDVDPIAELLADSFAVDDENSIDKRAAHDPDRFGYVSLHLVARLSPDRASLPEWAGYRDDTFELQIRSALQHAWAEIEHDLGYKSASAIPVSARRSFSRLAGLVELADAEFDRLRAELRSHRGELAARLTEEPDAIGIDADSLAVLIDRSELVAALDAEIGRRTGVELLDYPEGIADMAAARLAFLGVPTVDRVENLLAEHRGDVLGVATALLRPATSLRGISVFYLPYALLLRQPESEIERFFREFKLSDGIRNYVLVHAKAGGGA